MEPLGTITAWDGITYTITAWYPLLELTDGRWLGNSDFTDPDGEAYAVQVIVPADGWDGPIFTASDWECGGYTEEAAGIPTIRWVDVRTGAAAVMLDNLPHLSPFAPGPGARTGSYGR